MNQQTEEWTPARIDQRLRLRLAMILNEFDILIEWAKACDDPEILQDVNEAKGRIEAAKTRVCQDEK